MQRIVVNQEYKDFVALVTVESDATLTLTIRKASGGTLSGGAFVFSAGVEWQLTFTPLTLNEIYSVTVTDAEGDTVFHETYKALGTVWDAETGPTGTIVVGTNSWVTADEAETYFATRFGVGTNWSGQTNADKIAALVSAYRQLTGCSEFSIDPAEDADAVKNAQCEMALFLIIHQADMDARKGLQAQGVKQAGIVQETYEDGAGGAISVPAMVRDMLSGYASGSPLLAANVERDDDEDA